MEKPAEQDVELAGDNDHQTPVRPNVRRRLIQPTLFPHSSSQEKDKDVQDCNNEGGDEDEEYCGSQTKKKRKPSRKITPVSKKVSENGNDSLSGSANKKKSPASVKSNFFVKVSDKRQQKKQQCGDSPEGNSQMCSPMESVSKDMRSPQKLKERRLTPKKSAKTNGLKVPCSGQISSATSEHESQPLPDLRLEAKMTAEENSRLFAGKQIHPFFSSRKPIKKCQEIIDVDDYNCSDLRKDKSFTLGPIHVFETFQDEVLPFDWKNWILFENTAPTSNCTPQIACPSIFEGSVDCFNIDEFLEVSRLSTASYIENMKVLDHCPVLKKCSSARTCSATLAYEHVMSFQPREDPKMYRDAEQMGIFPGLAGNVENLVDHQENKVSHESNLPQDILWTEKYQPAKSTEVCGNTESVKFLSEWLHLWHERDFRTGKVSANDDKCTSPNGDQDYYDSSYDSDNSDEGAHLKNVLLVTGPVGSGKSAAIYACAKEQGFKVIEVNSSDCRNGALVKQHFREAVESHRFKWSQTNHGNTPSKSTIDISPALPRSHASQDFDSDIIEFIPLLDEEECHDAAPSCKREDGAACSQEGIKSLVVFEDVDITFIEDRGLIAAIQQLAETAKLPMILTTNSIGPVLPENFDRLELCFTAPSPAELLSHVHMVCAAENSSINSHLREKLVEHFQGDIRKTIMHLQFWCQGKRSISDWSAQRTYAPLPFDILAGHHILPKIIQWNLSSPLSELIDNEISKSLTIMEETCTSMHGVAEENEEMLNELWMDKTERESIKAKEEALLSMNSSYYNYNEFQAPNGNFPDSPGLSGSPVTFTRNNARVKLDRVLSFSSDDELCDGRLHQLAIKESSNNNLDLNFEFFSIPSPIASENCLNLLTDSLPHCKVPSESPSKQKGLNPIINQLFHSEAEKMEESYCGCLDKDVDTVNETCRSIDVSRVPESSYIPETEMNEGMEIQFEDVSGCHAPDAAEVVSMRTELTLNMSPVRPENNEKPLSRLCKRSEKIRNNFDLNVESSQGEEVGDSQIEPSEFMTRGYQVMDECSRMDFNRKIDFYEKPGSCVVTDSVQETWAKLRGRHADLRQYITLEEKHASQILKLASEASNLISDADLLLSYCNFLTCDSLESSMGSSEESDTFNWYSELIQMTSTLTEHGFCLYVKDVAAKETTISFNCRVDLVSEMLASMSDTMALGKLIRQEMEVNTPHTTGITDMSPSRPGLFLKRKTDSCLQNTIQSLVPSRSLLALKGVAFSEYLSSLGQIQRSEASRLSSGTANTTYTRRRRGRAARHHLSTGALGLSPEDISVLNQYKGYEKNIQSDP